MTDRVYTGNFGNPLTVIDWVTVVNPFSEFTDPNF